MPRPRPAPERNLLDWLTDYRRAHFVAVGNPAPAPQLELAPSLAEHPPARLHFNKDHHLAPPDAGQQVPPAAAAAGLVSWRGLPRLQQLHAPGGGFRHVDAVQGQDDQPGRLPDWHAHPQRVLHAFKYGVLARVFQVLDQSLQDWATTMTNALQADDDNQHHPTASKAMFLFRHRLEAVQKLPAPLGHKVIDSNVCMPYNKAKVKQAALFSLHTKHGTTSPTYLTMYLGRTSAGKPVVEYVHRLMLFMFKGPPPAVPPQPLAPVPPGAPPQKWQASHACCIHQCLNPSHLKWASAASNASQQPRLEPTDPYKGTDFNG